MATPTTLAPWRYLPVCACDFPEFRARVGAPTSTRLSNDLVGQKEEREREEGGKERMKTRVRERIMYKVDEG